MFFAKIFANRCREGIFCKRRSRIQLPSPCVVPAAHGTAAAAAATVVCTFQCISARPTAWKLTTPHLCPVSRTTSHNLNSISLIENRP